MAKKNPEGAASNLSTRNPASKQYALRGLKVVDANLRARLLERKRAVIIQKSLDEKIAAPNVQVRGKNGANFGALTAARRRLWAERQSAMKARPRVPRASETPLVSQLTNLQPPYSYSFSNAGQIDIAPGTFTAYASAGNGQIGFNLASSPSSGQINKSYASAAVGSYFKPSSTGVLSVFTTAPMDWNVAIDGDYAGADSRGWAGFLVQRFDSNNTLSATSVYQQNIQYDVFENGQFIYFFTQSYLDLQPQGVPVPLHLSASFLVEPFYWYAIWVWCGGNIHAEGWQYILGIGKGSDAAGNIALTVPYILLEFVPSRPVPHRR
jgi:hypothetical protein